MSSAPAGAGGAAMARDPGIDTLRGVAIAVVLLLHFSLTYRLASSPLGALFSPEAVRAVVNNGNYGVTIFFAVSGFLIASNTLRRRGSLGAVDVRAFYVQRASRILPGLVVAVAAIVVLGLAGRPSFVNASGGHVLPDRYFLIAAGSVLTFTHNLLMQSAGYFNYALNIYWSLSVEEVFYLLFPLACVTLRRPAWIALACLAAIVVGPFYRSAHGDDEIFFMYGYAACFDAIAFGVLAALAAQVRKVPIAAARAGVVVSALALAAAYLRGIHAHETFGFSAVALAAAALLCFNASLPSAPRSARGRVLTAPLRWAGRHSYELYLFHIIVLGLLRDAVPRDQLGYAWKLPWLGIYLSLSVALAAVVARVVTEPANAAIRRRFLAARTRPRDVQAAAVGDGALLAETEKVIS